MKPTSTLLRKINRIVVGAGLSVLLLSVPASAFFNELDGLKEMLATATVTPEDGLEELVAELERPATSAFSDVRSSEWYHNYVRFVADIGLVSGYRDSDGFLTGQFGPADQVTVAQMLKMAVKAAQIDEATCAQGTTIPQARGHWAEIYIRCGETMHMRVLATYPDLNRPAKRAEVLAIIHDAFSRKVPPLYSNFPDAAGNEYESDIAYAVMNGVVSGDKAADGTALNSYRPNDGLKRSEAAKVLYESIKAYATL